MSVYYKKRKDGSKAWYYRFQHKGEIYIAVGGTTKTEALRTQEKVRAEVLSGEYGFKRNTKNPTLELFSEKFLERRRDHKSFDRDVYLVNHLLKRFGKKRLSAINPEDLEDYKAWRKSQNVANATVNRELACLKRMYNQAIDWGDAIKNPVKKVKFLREPKKKDRYVNREEASKLINDAPKHFKPILITAFQTGMRKEEILSLKWEQIHIWDTGGEIELVNTKNGEKRYVPLNKTMIELFSKMEKKSEYVFLSTRGERLNTIRKTMATTFKRAGVEKATFHDFRHSWASWMSETGVDPYTIMEIGGWADMKTLERYLHRTRADRQRAVENLDGILTESVNLYYTKQNVLKMGES